MISLVMGLIVALAAVALAKSATTSFHETARMSGVEMTLRSASERLRADLLKASYMSTPNIQLDDKIARTPGAPGNARMTSLADLQGIYIARGAGTANTQGPLNLATLHNLSPDDLFIAGNTTSDDMYRAQWVANSSCGGGGPRLRISGVADPAVNRMFNGAATPADQITATKAVFMPGSNMQPPVLAKYAVQVTDMRGCTNYLTICDVTTSPDANSVFLELDGDGAKGILTPDDTKSACGGRLMEEFSIAPIMRVHWYLAANDLGPPAKLPDPRLYDNLMDPGGANKFNLYRQLLAADGATAVGPAEIVAEYAVDLKFGLVVDNNLASPLQHAPLYIDMEGQEAVIDQWMVKASASVTGVAGPQHVRSVRYRMAFRAPYYDREGPLTINPGPPYLGRYCIATGTLATCKQWARVRTVLSEVALLNQEKAFY